MEIGTEVLKGGLGFLCGNWIQDRTKPSSKDGKFISKVKDWARDDVSKIQDGPAQRSLEKARDNIYSAYKLVHERYEEKGKRKLWFTDPALVIQLHDYYKAAKDAALEHFRYETNVTHRATRIEALQIAMYSEAYGLFVTNQCLGDGVEAEKYLALIFNDDDLREALEYALGRIDEKAEIRGEYVILLIEELQTLSKQKIDEGTISRCGLVSRKQRNYPKLLRERLEESKLESLIDIGFTTIADQLRQLYKSKYMKVSPLSFLLPQEFHMDKMWAPLTLGKRGNDDRDFVNGIEAYDKTIKLALKKNKLTIVTGKPFFGKTTLARKIAYDWAVEKDKDYDLVLLAPIRDVPQLNMQENYAGILDMVVAYIESISGCSFDYLLRMDFSNRKLLVILDGYDEERTEGMCTELHKLLQPPKKNAPDQPKYDILITNRPSKTILRAKEASFLSITDKMKVIGFHTDDQRKEFIRRHVETTGQGDVLKIMEIVRNVGPNHDLIESPLMLTLICLLHDKLETGSVSELLSLSIRQIIERWVQKDENFKALFPAFQNSAMRNDTKIRNISKWRDNEGIKRLGKLAYDMLLDKKVTFDGGDLQPMDESNFSEMGLLLMDSRFDGPNLTSQLEFIHRVFQDFLAALYVIYWSKEDKVITEQLQNAAFDQFHNYFIELVFNELLTWMSERALESLPLQKLMERITDNRNYPFSFQLLQDTKKQFHYLREILKLCTKLEYVVINGNGAHIDFLFKQLLSVESTIKEIKLHAFICSSVFSLERICRLKFDECSFETQPSVTNCPTLEYLEFRNCKMNSNTILDITDLPAIDNIGFYKCTFEADSQLSITTCPSLKNLIFSKCEMKSSTIVRIATLPAIDTVQFDECEIDSATWQSIADAIRKSSIKFLKFSFGKDFNKEFLVYLQQCNSDKKIIIKIKNYKIFPNDLLSFTDLATLYSLTFEICTFETNSQLSITNCQALKNLEFKNCKMKSSTILSFAILPETDTVQFNECTIEANSQLSFTNYLSLKNLIFYKCEIENSTIVSNATLPAVDTVQFNECKTDLATWRSITDAIENFSVKYLKLTFGKIPFGEEQFKNDGYDRFMIFRENTTEMHGEYFNKEFLTHLQHCKNLEKMEIAIWSHKICQDDLLSFTDLIKLHSLTLSRCTFEVNSQLSFKNCKSLKNLILQKCEIESSLNLGIATLSAINTVEFSECTIDLAAWPSIADDIKSSSVKYLKLILGEEFNKTLLTHLQLCGDVEKVKITMQNYKFPDNDILSFSGLKLYSVTFEGCTFEASFQLSFENCQSLEKLKFQWCDIKNSTNVGIATLTVTDTVQFADCTTDLTTWQSIADEIRSSSVKYLKLSADYFLKESYPEFLRHLQKCERIEQINVKAVYDSDNKHIFEHNEEQATKNLAHTAEKLPGLRSITIFYECNELNKGARLSEENKERIEKAGRKRNSEFSVIYKKPCAKLEE